MITYANKFWATGYLGLYIAVPEAEEVELGYLGLLDSPKVLGWKIIGYNTITIQQSPK